MIKKIIKDLDLDRINIEDCTAEEFLSILENINRKIRGKADDEEVFETTMSVGEHHGVPQETRIPIIYNLLNTMKKLEDSKDKAALCYYTINLMHMFSNGNGRTSRFIYSYLNGQLDKVDELNLIHEDEGSGNTNLEEREGLIAIDSMDSIQAMLLKEKYRKIGNFIDLIDEYDVIRGGPVPYGNNSIINETAIKELSQDEIDSIYSISCQSAARGYTASALAMIITTINKGELQEWEKLQHPHYNEFLDAYAFSFSYKKAKTLLENWSALDYRMFIDQGDYFIIEGYQCMNEVFLNKTKRLPNSDDTYYDCIVKQGQSSIGTK